MMSKLGFLLLDEPSLGLAPKLARQMFGVSRTVREQSTTILLVGQNARAALAITDRGVYIENRSNLSRRHK